MLCKILSNKRMTQNRVFFVFYKKRILTEIKECIEAVEFHQIDLRKGKLI